MSEDDYGPRKARRLIGMAKDKLDAMAEDHEEGSEAWATLSNLAGILADAEGEIAEPEAGA